MNRALRSRARRLTVALGIAAAACGCGGQPSASPLTILVPWQGNQLKVFKAIAKTYAESHGFTVQVDSTRGLTDVLSTELQQRDPPDVADLPSIGVVRQDAASLRRLDGIRPGNYSPFWLSLMRVRPGLPIYAVPFKIDVKSLIWYDPAMLDSRPYAVPHTWTQLETLSTAIQKAGRAPWCVPLSSAPVSGWPGADWIADVLLSNEGPVIYQQWVDGTLSWNSAPVRTAWQEWGQLIGLSDPQLKVTQAALDWSVGKLKPKPGGCYLEHGTLVDSTARTATFAQQFVTFPSRTHALQVSADFLVRFGRSQHATELIRYLTRPHVQEQWAWQARGFSADKNVPVSNYQGSKAQIARLMASAPELCLGADDAMRPDLSEAFDRAAWRYVAEPGSLANFLPVLQTVSSHPPPEAGHTPLSALHVCGPP